MEAPVFIWGGGGGFRVDLFQCNIKAGYFVFQCRKISLLEYVSFWQKKKPKQKFILKPETEIE